MEAALFGTSAENILQHSGITLTLAFTGVMSLVTELSYGFRGILIGFHWIYSYLIVSGNLNSVAGLSRESSSTFSKLALLETTHFSYLEKEIL